MSSVTRFVIITGLLFASLASASTGVDAQTVAERSFEIVSIRPSSPGTRWNMKDSGDRMTLTGCNARVLVADAYGMDLPNIVGGPAWMDGDQYDVTASFGEALMAKLATVSPQERSALIFTMLRSMMGQRFGLVIHH